MAAMNDPFLVASAVRGYEQLLVDQIADPAAAHRLLGTVLRTLKEGARIMREECGVEAVFLEDGIADIAQNDLGSSTTFDIPYAAELVGHMRGLGLKVVLSNCTLGGYLEQQYISCAPDALHLASEAKAYPQLLQMAKGERCLVSGINAVRKILPMAPDEIEAEVGKLVAGFGDGPGHIVAAGGEMPMETPLENILALSRATRGL
jgi:uroporphyrinogen-III decarboxylase